jgi:pyrimidine operon attenuation protein/uracil phosphoribosyltransferase
MVASSIVMDAAEIDAVLRRMASEIVAAVHEPERLVLIGIRTAGVFLGRRLQAVMAEALRTPVRFGCLDITLYRDDLYTGLEKPRVGPTDITFPIDGLDIVLVDDVLFTGRTVRAALDELMDLGRPRRIHLAVLIDRGHRELPISADIVGRRIETTLQQQVKVHLREDARYFDDQVRLIGPSEPAALRDERCS